MKKTQEGLKIYGSLPKVLQRDKSILVLSVSLLAIRDGVAYADSLKLYADTFPNGPSLTLMMIDYYIVKEDYPKACASIDAIEKEVGHDPVLSALRSGIALTQVHYEEALSFAEQALSADPTLEDAHWSAIPASLHEDFSSMLSHLVSFRDSFDHEFDPKEFRNEELYQKFMASSEAITFFGDPIE
ncbi:MAG: hypothetical protein GWQ05_27675 [Verrucomicrobiaceae bacterium]|nr:hypothetical protein [Verrucomicrobiaceae bacterium]